MPITPHPLLPVELYAPIFDFLGERKFGEPLNPDQTQALGECSLACKHFAALSQPHIFGYIDLKTGLDCDTEKEEGEIFLSFAELLEESPHLATHVREFDIYLPRYSCDIPPGLDRWRKAFLSFPNLKYLIINDMSNETTPVFRCWTGLCDNLIETYLGIGTLSSLRIQRFAWVASIPITQIFPTGQLRHLHIGICTIPPAILLPISNITTFYAVHSIKLPLSIFLALPALETLYIVDAVVIRDPLPRSRSPSFKLKELSLGSERYPHAVSRIFDLFSTSARTAQTQPFLQLESLKIVLKQPRDIRALAACIGQMPSLRSLMITSSSHMSTIFPIELLNPQHHVLETLTELTIDIGSRGYDPVIDTPPFLPQLSSFLASIAGRNVLETLNLTTPEMISSMELPDSTMYRQLASQLADTTAFPRLKRVCAELVLCTLGSLRLRLERHFRGKQDELIRHIMGIMEELVERRGVVVIGRLRFGPL